MRYVAAAAIGYLLGSVPAALWTARRHGVDLRRTSDGNPGAWNALEQLGPRRALPAFAGDALKGSAAAGAGLALGGIEGGYVGAGAAMLGHAFPAFAGLRGGKGVMTFVGAGLVLSPAAGAVAVGACAATTAATRSFAVGARVGVASFPVAQLAFDPVERVAATGGLMTLIGALFLLRRNAPATSGPGAGPTT
jgi:acyl phosphate:glycerol-3-phosphate acyltransferase